MSSTCGILVRLFGWLNQGWCDEWGCGMHWRENNRGILWGNLKNRDHMEYLGINVKTVFKMFLKKQAERQGLKHLAQDHYKQQALVSMVITLWVRHSVGNFLTSWKPVNFSKMTAKCSLKQTYSYLLPEIIYIYVSFSDAGTFQLHFPHSIK